MKLNDLFEQDNAPKFEEIKAVMSNRLQDIADKYNVGKIIKDESLSKTNLTFKFLVGLRVGDEESNQVHSKIKQEAKSEWNAIVDEHPEFAGEHDTLMTDKGRIGYMYGENQIDTVYGIVKV